MAATRRAPESYVDLQMLLGPHNKVRVAGKAYYRPNLSTASLLFSTFKELTVITV
jgi:hypothetical protein